MPNKQLHCLSHLFTMSACKMRIPAQLDFVLTRASISVSVTTCSPARTAFASFSRESVLALISDNSVAWGLTDVVAASDDIGVANAGGIATGLMSTLCVERCEIKMDPVCADSG